MKRFFVALCCATLGFSVVSAQEPVSDILLSDTDTTLVAQDDAPATPVADTPTPTPDSIEAAPIVESSAPVVDASSQPIVESSTAPVVVDNTVGQAVIPMNTMPMTTMPGQISTGEYYPAATPMVGNGYVQNGDCGCCGGCQSAAPMTYAAAPTMSYAPAPTTYAAAPVQGCSSCASAPATYAAAPATYAPAPTTYAAAPVQGCSSCAAATTYAATPAPAATYTSAPAAPAADCCPTRTRPQVIARVRGRLSNIGSRRSNCCN